MEQSLGSVRADILARRRAGAAVGFEEAVPVGEPCTTARSSRWRVADRAITAVLIVATVCWSALYAVVGPLFLRPVSTCGGPEQRCTHLVDLGVGVGSWGPAAVTVLVIAAVAWRGARARMMAPAALIGVVVVIALQVVGQVLVTNGVVAR